MSESRPVVQYLQSQLRANPFREAEGILRRRARHLGAKPKPTDHRGQTPSTERREAAQELIRKVREQFWSLPLDDLRRQLAAVDLKEFPDLKAAADRLLYVATYRPMFPQLAQHKRFNSTFFSVFKRIVVLPPREAGALKDDVLRSLAAHRDVRACQRMVQVIKSEFPQLYQLDPHWLDAILKLKRRAGPLVLTSPSSGEGGFSIPGWAIVVVVVVVIRILAILARNSSP